MYEVIIFICFHLYYSSLNIHWVSAGCSNSTRKYSHITTVVGNGVLGSTGDGISLSATSLAFPEGIWIATEGKIFVAENGHGGTVRQIDGKTKTVTSHADLNSPTQLAFDGVNNLYVGLAGNDQIIKLNVMSSETIVIAGTASGQSHNGDRSRATSTTLTNPRGVWLDPTCVVYIAEHSCHIVRRIDASGIISVVAGIWGSNGYSGDGGQATSAMFDHPLQIYGDTVNRLFVSDLYNHKVRAINLNTGIITTIAGNGQSTSTDVVQSATATPLHSPKGVWGDAFGNVVVTEYGGSRIKFMDTLNMMFTIAGCGVVIPIPIEASVSDLIGDGGPPTAASFRNLKYVFIDTSGIVYFSDSGNNRVRKLYDHPLSTAIIAVAAAHFTKSENIQAIKLLDFPPSTTSPTQQPSYFRSTQLVINTIAGSGSATYNGNDIKATSASVNNPTGVWSDSMGNVYFSEVLGNRVRKVDKFTNMIYAVAGGITAIASASTSAMIGDGGRATSAMIYNPYQVFGDPYNNLYVADHNNHRVRIVNVATGIISTLCGNGYITASGNGGQATSASVFGPVGVWKDTASQIFIGEFSGHMIRKVDNLGIITTIAGTGVISPVGASTSAMIGDGGQATAATFRNIYLISGSLSFALYVVDTNNHRVRCISLDYATIVSVAGTGETVSSNSINAATSIAINSPAGVFIDTTYYLYISESTGRKLKLVNPSGIMVTMVGFVAATGSNGPEMNNGDDGAASAAVLGSPYGLFVETSGVVYFCDLGYHKIRTMYDISPTYMPTHRPTTSPTERPSFFRSTLLEIDTVAGTGLTVYNGDGIKATSAGTYTPTGVWSDSMGNVYFSETHGHRVRKVDKLTNIVYTVAGSIIPPDGASTSAMIGDSGRATSAMIYSPQLIFGDPYNNLYVADYRNHRVRIISLATNIINTFCGNGYATSTGNGGQATSASTYFPTGIWLDTVNQLFFSEVGGNVVRKVNVYGIITTIAGTGVTSAVGASTSAMIGDGGSATTATLNDVYQIYGGLSPALYIADYSDHRVRCITLDYGTIFSVAGTGETVSSNSVGSATATGINWPIGVFGDTTCFLYIADHDGNKIKLVNPAGIMVTLVGFVAATGSNGPQMNNGDGGAASAAVLGLPFGLFVETSGIIYVCNYAYHRVRKIYDISPTYMPTFRPTIYQSSQSLIATVAGTGGTVFNGDNIRATAAVVSIPRSPWCDSIGNLYISEYSGNRIRKVDVNQIISTVMGTGVASATGASTSAMIGDSGPATSATLNGAQQLTQSLNGDVYVTDMLNDKVRMITDGLVTTIAGTGMTSPINVQGVATSVVVLDPVGIWLDSVKNVYIAEYSSHLIRKVLSNSKMLTTIAGTGSAGTGTGDQGDGGKATSARFRNPYQLYGDTSNVYLYVGDYNNYRIRRINLRTTVIETIAGTGVADTTNIIGPATACPLQGAVGVWLNVNGDIFISEYEGHKIKRVDALVIIKTVAGYNGPSVTSLGPNGDGGPPTAAAFNFPQGLFVDSSGSVFIADVGNNKVRKLYEGSPTCSPSVTPTMPTSQPTIQPSGQPSTKPSSQTTMQPSSQPSIQPFTHPSRQPLCVPSVQPSEHPSSQPTNQPFRQPSSSPSCSPSIQPSAVPSVQPSRHPSEQPSSVPSTKPTCLPSRQPTCQPNCWPTAQPSVYPTSQPWNRPSSQPSTWPSSQSTLQPSGQPRNDPTSTPTMQPGSTPSCQPTSLPSAQPFGSPTSQPTLAPFSVLSCQPSRRPTSQPSMSPLTQPSVRPSMQPSMQPSCQPVSYPSSQPTIIPSNTPTARPTMQPTNAPTAQPSAQLISAPSSQPSTIPSSQPKTTPTVSPSTWPTSQPYGQPSCCPSMQPSATPSQQPTSVPSTELSDQPQVVPSTQPSNGPSTWPTGQPLSHPSTQPSSRPSCCPSKSSSQQPNTWPTMQPYSQPSSNPSRQPTAQPSRGPLHPSAPPLQLGESSVPTFASEQPSLSPTQLPGVSVNYTTGIVSEFKIVLPYMFTDPVSGNGRYDVQVPDATSGRGNLIFGSKFSTTTARIGSSSLNMFPIISYDYTARSVSNAGDVNGDSYDDLIIGVPYASRCHVLFGNENGFTNMMEGFTITGLMESDLFGWSVASAGDVNNDTFADILIGAPKGGGESSVGVAYILYGRRVWSDMDISELSDGDGFFVYGAMTQESLGISVSGAGDINGDGYDDVIIGALSMHSFFSGAIYVVFGQVSMSQSTYSVRELTGSIGIAIEGPAWSWFGYSVGRAGDVNGDCMDDMLIGSVPRKMVVEAPVSYIIFGRKTGSFPVSVASLSYLQGVRLIGGGIVVSIVGDVNGDSCDDILLGSDIEFKGAGYVLVKPYMFPMLSVDPTSLPVVNPSLNPTQVPSLSPSVKPTAPTVTPSVVPTGPTFSPSMNPTQPTSVPTVTPTAPSQAPSVTPTIAPSYWPSHGPTVMTHVWHSNEPTVHPTLRHTSVPTTRLPSYKPTIVTTGRPTGYPVVRPSAMPVTTESPVIANITYSIVVVESGGVVSRTLNDTLFIVNSTADVVIEGTGGCAKFTILPNTNTSLTIEHFKPESDLIDLQAFKTLLAFSELINSAAVVLHTRHLLDEQYPSLLISLPQRQHILIANLTITQLSSKNFIFSKHSQEVPVVGRMKRSYGPLIVLCTVLGSLGFYVLFKVGSLWFENLFNERLNAKVTDWDSDNVRENPTFISFNITDSDRSILSDISSDSEGDGDMDSSIEISSESQESVAQNAVPASPTAQLKIDYDRRRSGSLQSKDSSAFSDSHCEIGVSEKASDSGSDHSSGHRARFGSDMPDCIEDEIMRNSAVHYAQSKDDSVDFEAEGHRSYMSSSVEEDSEVARYDNQWRYANQYQNIEEQQHNHTVCGLWEQPSSMHCDHEYSHQQHQQQYEYAHHHNEAPQYFWNEEDQLWYEYYRDEYPAVQYQPQQQQLHHDENVYTETIQYADGSNHDVGDYDVEANYQQQQHQYDQCDQYANDQEPSEQEQQLGWR